MKLFKEFLLFKGDKVDNLFAALSWICIVGILYIAVVIIIFLILFAL